VELFYLSEVLFFKSILQRYLNARCSLFLTGRKEAVRLTLYEFGVCCRLEHEYGVREVQLYILGLGNVGLFPASFAKWICSIDAAYSSQPDIMSDTVYVLLRSIILLLIAV
jgi:hypothetical protein